jgi:hypothetical protein
MAQEAIDTFVANILLKTKDGNGVLVSRATLVELCYEPHRLNKATHKMLNAFHLPSKLDYLDELCKQKGLVTSSLPLYEGAELVLFQLSGYNFNVPSASASILNVPMATAAHFPGGFGGMMNVPRASGYATVSSGFNSAVRGYIEEEIQRRAELDLHVELPSR